MGTTKPASRSLCRDREMYLNASSSLRDMCTMGSARPAAWSRWRSWEPGDAYCPDQYPERGAGSRRLVEYTIRQCEKDQVEVTSVSPVVGECNDCRINRIQHRAVSMEDVMEAFSGAGEDFLEIRSFQNAERRKSIFSG